MFLTRLLVATSVAMSLLSTSAFADPKFEYGKAEEVEKVKEVEWTAAAEFGLVFTTGNSDTTTIAAGLKASRKTGKNKLSLEGSMTYAKSSIRVLDDINGNGLIDSEDEIVTQETVTAETYASKIRYDRFLTKSNSLFAALLAARDLPAGKQSVVGGQVGYSRLLSKSKKSEAVGEIGLDYARENLVAGAPVHILSARAFVGYKAEMTEGANVDASTELLTNLNHEDLATRVNGAGVGEDTRITVKVAFSAKIGKNLAVQTSVEARYDHRPAPLAIKGLAAGFVPEASRLDTMMKASLIYTLF